MFGEDLFGGLVVVEIVSGDRVKPWRGRVGKTSKVKVINYGRFFLKKK